MNIILNFFLSYRGIFRDERRETGTFLTNLANVALVLNVSVVILGLSCSQ